MLNTMQTISQAVLLPLTYGIDSLLARAPASSDARLSLLASAALIGTAFVTDQSHNQTQREPR